MKYVRLYHPLNCLYWGFASQSTLFRSCCHCLDAYLREGFFLEDKTQCWWDSNTVLYSSASSTTRPPCSQIVVYEQDETESLSTSFEARRLNLIINIDIDGFTWLKNVDLIPLPGIDHFDLFQ